MNDIREMVFSVCIIFAFCFLVFNVRACTTEQMKIELEMRKYPVKVEQTVTNQRTMEVMGPQK